MFPKEATSEERMLGFQATHLQAGAPAGGAPRAEKAQGATTAAVAPEDAAGQDFHAAFERLTAASEDVPAEQEAEVRHAEVKEVADGEDPETEQAEEAGMMILPPPPERHAAVAGAYMVGAEAGASDAVLPDDVADAAGTRDRDRGSPAVSDRATMAAPLPERAQVDGVNVAVPNAVVPAGVSSSITPPVAAEATNGTGITVRDEIMPAGSSATVGASDRSAASHTAADAGAPPGTPAGRAVNAAEAPAIARLPGTLEAAGQGGDDRDLQHMEKAPVGDHRASYTPSAEPRIAGSAFGTGPQIARHVAVQISQAAARGTGRPIELTLSPAELGRVRITLTPGEGGMVVNVGAERAETLDLMRRHIDLLGDEFRDLGYGQADFTFSQEDRAGRQTERARFQVAIPLEQEPQMAVIPAPARQEPRLVSERVDIRL